MVDWISILNKNSWVVYCNGLDGDPKSSTLTWIKDVPHWTNMSLREMVQWRTYFRYPRWSMYLSEAVWCRMKCLPALCSDLVERYSVPVKGLVMWHCWLDDTIIFDAYQFGSLLMRIFQLEIDLLSRYEYLPSKERVLEKYLGSVFIITFVLVSFCISYKIK